MGQFFDELKRRNVMRVAVAYVIAAWLVLQVADLVLENISAPDWIMQVFMLAFALGFPLVLIFSWVYELTAQFRCRDYGEIVEKQVRPPVPQVGEAVAYI